MEVGSILNEKSVALLESHWSELPSLAYCENEDGGWRIHLVGSSPVFMQAGFRNQDVVAGDALLAHAKTSETKGLVERLLAILEHIKK